VGACGWACGGGGGGWLVGGPVGIERRRCRRIEAVVKREGQERVTTGLRF